jgi:hypothetical protein
MIKDNGVLYIEPSNTASPEPVIDELTRKMTAAYRQSVPAENYTKGVHICNCGATSDNREHVLPNGEETNSLCIHYLAFHRDEVPQFQLDKVSSLNFGEEEPSHSELHRRTN